MLKSSYKYHLHILRIKTKSSFTKKTLQFFAFLLLLLIGASTAFVYWLYKAEAPLRAEVEYLEAINGGFITTKQSVSELLETFQVAGTKTILVDNLKEASSSVLPTGYIVLLEDIDKTVAKIESTERLIKNKKLDLKKLETPFKFENTSRDLSAFYDQVLQTLESSQQDQAFTKEMIVAMGENLYLPTLSDETLWTLKNEEQIKNYYKNKKTELDTSLAALSRLSPPEAFRLYHQTQIAYLTNLADVSDKIINTLSLENDQSTDSPLQIEKAYQILNAYKKDNDITAEKLFTERNKAFDLKRNYDIYATLKIKQNSLEQKLTEISASQPQIKNFKTPKLIVDLIDKSKTILNSLQIPSLI